MLFIRALPKIIWR